MVGLAGTVYTINPEPDNSPLISQVPATVFPATSHVRTQGLVCPLPYGIRAMTQIPYLPSPEILDFVHSGFVSFELFLLSIWLYF